MFDFPSSPSEGQIYIPSASGPTYVYAGGIWKFQSQPGIVGTAETRNRIVNPVMQISQENGDTTSAANAATSAYWMADQWYGNWTVGVGTLQAGRLTLGVPTPNGSWNTVQVVCATAVTSLAAGSAVGISQSIEGNRLADLQWGTANAKSIVLRFLASFPAGTYSVAIANAVADRTYIAQFTTTSTAWEEVVLSIPGDTTGTWNKNNTVGMYLQFNVAAGSTYLGVTGWQAGNKKVAAGQLTSIAASAGFAIAEVGLYLDPDNTGKAPPFEVPDWADELRACQRYWERTQGIQPLWSGNCTTAIAYIAGAQWITEKRANPTLSGVNIAASGFPATVGTLTNASVREFYETRTSNATANGGQFNTAVTGNARM